MDWRFVVFLMIFGVFGSGPIPQCVSAEDNSRRAPTVTDEIPTAWLQRKVSLADAEAENSGIRDERVNRFPEAGRPFGFNSPKWEAMKAALKPGDEIWTFAGPVNAWEHMAGRAGIAVVRDGRVIGVLVTIMN